MIQVDVTALAKLAKLEVSEVELARLEKEIPEILGFVETVQKASADAPSVPPHVHNVMREDANAHESGAYTRELLDAAPAQKNDQVVVKQVISRKK